MQMKLFLFWVFFLLLGIPFFTSMTRLITKNRATPTTSIRKLMEGTYKDTKNMNLDDYHLIDPPPSSTVNITSGPIEHGTPLIPFIPKPTPPYRSEHGDSPIPPSPP